MRSARLVADDYAQVIATACRLHAVGARRGVRIILFNAAAIAQRQPAEIGDLAQRPAFGRRVEAAEYPDAANDHSDPQANPLHPAPAGGGL